MNDSHDIDMPYHPGCKHRYIEHLDHNALIKRLNEIADEIYRLTQLCVGLQEQLVTHDGSSDAHRAIRESITAVGTRISTIKVAIDDSISALDDKVDANYSTLTAADGQLANRINSITDELEDIQNALDNVSLNLGEGITSTVSGNTPIITSTSNSGDVTLAELPSTHGKFRYKAEDTGSTITYTADNNSTGVPNYTATLIDETGNASFPRTISATTFDGNATTATLADTANRLNNSIDITIKDASGENTGSTVTTDLSGDVTLRLPATLKGTDITGTASKASADATGANIADTYMHKTNVNEEIAGIKTFNDGVKSNSITPKTHTGSALGSNNTPYEHIYGTNINGTSAVIGTVTGNLNGNAATATKLATARTINGTTFDGTTAITTTSWGTARDINITDASATNTSVATSIDGSGNATIKLPSTIKATLTGNASTATKLNTTRKINNTNFDGSADITTNIWGAARNITIADATATNIGNATSVNGSGNVTLKLPSTIVATAFNGVASSAKKLNVARTINGTAFDGSAAITTNTWGYSRNFTIATSDGANVGTSVTVDGSGDVTLKLPATINASMSGNAATATKLKTARTINGTAFDGSANITTTKWGTARTITIIDAGNEYTGSAVSVDGSSNITLKLPANIIADNFYGVATAARKLNVARTINGTAFDGSANITTDKWGTTRKITISDADGSHTSSAVSVNGSGDVTLKLPEHITARVIGKADTATEFYNNQSVTLTGDVTGTASSKAGWSVATTLANSGVTAGTYGPSANVTGNDNATISVPQIKVDAKGRVTSITNKTLTCKNTTYTIGNATTSAKGMMQVGSGLTVSDGVVSVADNYVKINESQDLNNTQINRALSNIGIEHFTSNSAYTHCRRLAIGNTQILYGMSSYIVRDDTLSDNTVRWSTAMYQYPFINRPLVLGTSLAATADDNATCCVIASSYSPRATLFGVGSPDHVSRVHYGAIGQSFPLVETAKVFSGTLSGSSSVELAIDKDRIDLSASKTTIYFLVDMFISANADSQNYIEFGAINPGNSHASIFGASRLSNTTSYTGSTYTRGYDVDLSYNPSSKHTEVLFNGYADISNKKLFLDDTFSTYKMRSFIVSVPRSDLANEGYQNVIFSFTKSLSSGIRGHIRVFYIPYPGSEW